MQLEQPRLDIVDMEPLFRSADRRQGIGLMSIEFQAHGHALGSGVTRDLVAAVGLFNPVECLRRPIIRGHVNGVECQGVIVPAQSKVDLVSKFHVQMASVPWRGFHGFNTHALV